MNKSYIIALLLAASTGKRLHKTDIRGPSTDGPTAGVYQWPTPAPAMAPIPGPFVATAAAFVQLKDVGATGSAGYDSHAVLSDALHADRKFKI